MGAVSEVTFGILRRSVHVLVHEESVIQIRMYGAFSRRRRHEAVEAPKSRESWLENEVAHLLVAVQFLWCKISNSKS